MSQLLVVCGCACVLMAAGAVTGSAAVRAAPGVEVADPPGDTVDEDDGTPLDVPEADIVRSSLVAAANGITLDVEVRTPTAPLSDPAWDGATGIEWDLDTTGDGDPDYLADYYTEAGRLTGQVYRFSDNDDEPPLCDLQSASYEATRVYRAVIDPACLGGPATVAYAAWFTYDTGPGDDTAPVAEDVAPDDDLSPAASAGAPAARPPLPAARPPLPAAVSSAAFADAATARPVPGIVPDDVPRSGAALPRTGFDRRGLGALAGAVIAVGGLCLMAGGSAAADRHGAPPGVPTADRRPTW